MDPDVMNYKSIKAYKHSSLLTLFLAAPSRSSVGFGASCTFISQLLHRVLILILLLLLLVVSCTYLFIRCCSYGLCDRGLENRTTAACIATQLQ